MVAIPQALFDKYFDAADDFINSNFGIDCILKYPPKELACINCIYDFKAKKSTNTYKPGGPIYFSFGVCPWCAGKGFKQDVITETVKMRVYWERKYWINVGIPINIPDNAIQTIGFMSDLPKIKMAQKMIANSTVQSINTWEYSLASEPIPHGFKRNRYIICYWNRI